MDLGIHSAKIGAVRGGQHRLIPHYISKDNQAPDWGVNCHTAGLSERFWSKDPSRFPTAKLELSALLHTAHKQLIDCIGVVHGIGSGVLKKALPHLLVQHPHVMAFHQAPLEYGGQGALLILVETAELESDPFK